MSAEPPLLDPSGRDRLLKAAVKLFGRDGFDGTSVRTVADEANVSWGLIRFHFGSKEKFRHAVEQWVMDRFLDRALHAAQALGSEEFSAIVEADSEEFLDVTRFLRRAILEERPMALEFIRRLIETDVVYKSLKSDYPDEAWLDDPIRTVGPRLSWLILEPQFKTILKRDVYDVAEIKLRHDQTNRILDLLRGGLEAERGSKETA